MKIIADDRFDWWEDIKRIIAVQFDHKGTDYVAMYIEYPDNVKEFAVLTKYYYDRIDSSYTEELVFDIHWTNIIPYLPTEMNNAKVDSEIRSKAMKAYEMITGALK